MSAAIIRYIVGGAMVAMAIYQAIKGDIGECVLYTTAGLAFITMALITDNVFPQYKKFLNVLSWILIISAGLTFLFLIQTG